jgi:diguanylate cyclase (GGDEF)-like protein
VDVTKLRPEFSVLAVAGDSLDARALVDNLKAAGYEDSRLFATPAEALPEVRELPPHVVLFDYQGFSSDAESFLTEVKTVSGEILVLLMVSQGQLLAGLELVRRGLAYDVLTRPFASELELVQKVDRGCAQLYYQFESEQLREHYESRESAEETDTDTHKGLDRTIAIASVAASASVQENESEASGGATSDWTIVAEALARFAATAETDQSVQVFMESLSRLQSNEPVLYFRYVPSHMSLLFSQAVLLPLEKFRGIGLDLKSLEASRLTEMFREPARLPGLSDLMEKVFRSRQFIAFGHWNDSAFLGLFVVLGRAELTGLNGSILGAEAPMPVLALQVAFELAYQRAAVLKDKHALDTTDPVSGLSSRRHFIRLLDEEISRSRRIMLPVTLITLELDRASLLQQKLGTQQVDSILKMVAAILKKTTRTNDVLARTGAYEFSVLLPHTGHSGGAVKAERLRRMIEATKFPLLEAQGLGALTVSCGVSEYPSFSSDAESLIQSSFEGLEQVKSAGGNRVCLAAAPDGFQMDFAPHDVPSWRGVSRVSDREPSRDSGREFGHEGER